MIVNLNGWPGAGKLSVGRHVAELLGGRLLDNHTVHNVAIALTERGSPEFYETVRAVREIAFRRVATLPDDTPIVMTNVSIHGGSGFAAENWQAILDLAHRRGTPLYSVTLTCSAAENARRIALPERALHRKLQDPGTLAELMKTRPLFDDGAIHRFTINNTGLAPAECASRIVAWIRGHNA